MELYIPCIASYQKLEIFQTSIPKATEFLRGLYIDIERPLSITFMSFQYFLSIKDDAWGIFFVILMKTKKEIDNKLVDF